ncbi:MAG: HalOD1 output domain-containing protein [Halodesulfurarchaeum sp.]
MSDFAVLTVAEAIAEAGRVDPMELDHALADHVDPDALQLLMDHESRSWSLSFAFPDHDVTVRGDGWIMVDGTRVKRWRSDVDGNGGKRVPVP